MAAPGRERLQAAPLTNALWLSAVATAVFAAWVLLDQRGWEYYATPLRVRGYHDVHRTLRPSGRLGHLFGFGGWFLMFVPVIYAARKRIPALASLGSMPVWLEVHIFCGIVGPVLVTFHTSFRFNGLISVAYWSMVAVALSGVVGRYLYVRIPRTVRGTELSLQDVEARLAALQAEADGGTLDPSGLDAVRRERALLAYRLAALDRTKRLFALWHVFHLPLVWLMFGIVTLHVGLALYLGYWPTW